MLSFAAFLLKNAEKFWGENLTKLDVLRVSGLRKKEIDFMPDALAGDAAGATTNLEAIARHYCGEAVVIQWHPAAHWLGLATRTEDGARIFLNPGAPLGDLAHVFFHECGHIALGHFNTPYQWTETLLEDSDIPNQQLMDKLQPAEARAWTEVIDRREAEAEQYAADALADFERRFGPFLAAL